jgi:hypothetical protein
MAFNDWRLYDFCDLKLLDYQMLPKALQAGFAIKDTGVGVEESELDCRSVLRSDALGSSKKRTPALGTGH